MRSHSAVLRISLIAALIAGPVVAVTATASAPTTGSGFTAQGSARQVYATGLAAGAQATLLNSAGQQVATKAADSLGGLIFDEVTPGSGYRVHVLPNGPVGHPTVQLFLAGGDDFLLEKLQFESVHGLDILGVLPVPIDEGAFGNVEVGGNMAQAPAAGTEFDEFVYFLFGVHGVVS